jgi:hypothetical protein
MGGGGRKEKKEIFKGRTSIKKKFLVLFTEFKYPFQTPQIKLADGFTSCTTLRVQSL